MTYDQHEARLRHLLQTHETLSLTRKRECEPRTDIEPLIMVVTTDRRAFHGSPGRYTWDLIGGEGIFAGRGLTSMLYVVAMSVIELMEREDCEPFMITISNEGYVRTFDEVNNLEEADQFRREHRLGDFRKDYEQNPASKVRETLMTTILSFPGPTEDDNEPTYSLLTQPFAWSDGGELVLDPVPTEREIGEIHLDKGGLIQVGVRLTPETAESNHHMMVEAIWNAVKARRAIREEANDG
jgi:hypothetical protein